MGWGCATSPLECLSCNMGGLGAAQWRQGACMHFNGISRPGPGPQAQDHRTNNKSMLKLCHAQWPRTPTGGPHRGAWASRSSCGSGTRSFITVWRASWRGWGSMNFIPRGFDVMSAADGSKAPRATIGDNLQQSPPVPLPELKSVREGAMLGTDARPGVACWESTGTGVTTGVQG